MAYPKGNANMKITRCIPFALTKSEPTEMFVSFYAEGIRYDYQVQFDVNLILHEELNYYPKGSKALFTNVPTREIIYRLKSSLVQVFACYKRPKTVFVRIRSIIIVSCRFALKTPLRKT